eukprot:scaffold310224_cov18-Tisochrysis_lutea.AAC.1
MYNIGTQKKTCKQWLSGKCYAAQQYNDGQSFKQAAGYHVTPLVLSSNLQTAAYFDMHSA